MKLKIGDKAPDFVLLVDDGRKISLEDFQDKSVLLYFYYKDDTPGCTNQAKRFSELYQDFLKKNIDIVGVSRDKLKSHAAFKAKYNILFHLASDENFTVANAYGAVGEKSMFGKKYFGMNRMTFLISKDQIIAGIWTNINVNLHPKEVLDSLE